MLDENEQKIQIKLLFILKTLSRSLKRFFGLKIRIRLSSETIV